MKRFYLLLLGLVVLIGLSGCSGARSNLTTLTPVPDNLGAYNTLWVSVESNVAEDIEDERVKLQDLIVSDLASRNLFTKVGVDDGSEPEEGTLVIKILITDVKKVGGAKRYFLGAFAGRAYMVSDVAFVGGSTGAVLGKYPVKGESGGTGLSGGTEDAVSQSGKVICDLVEQIRTGSATAQLQAAPVPAARMPEREKVAEGKEKVA